ncbi:diaminopimelate decarboxylase [Gephyromycinifex aptenodytis]|uniref:diaminopimelate decarboxylase n=1 Tax=Gephyromycinifex aptenodytis TaxID=2716227 RepID=UPI0014454FA2|nr:diaminopimelate decarboxylase [Gephyromycinifex aptenodytis]
MRAHEAGALHADGYGGPPQWLPYPGDVNALLPQLWPVSARRENGRLNVGGVDMVALAQEFGTPAYVIDELDFRQRAAAFRDDFSAPFKARGGGVDVYYAGKAFLCTQVARWVMDEGLMLDVCSGGELAVAQRVGFPGERVEMHGNNKSAAEIEAALAYGVGRIVADSFDEIARIAAIARDRGVVAPVMLRITVGVEAHTHEYIATAHEDQKFGFSLNSGQAERAVQAVLAEPDAMQLVGLHSHIGSQIFDVAGFEVAAARLLRLHAHIAERYGQVLEHLDLGGGFGIAYTSENTPATAADLGAGMAAIVERECAAAGVAMPRISIEPGRAIVGSSTFTLYEVGTVKEVDLDGGMRRRYVSVDGGMSDNVRTALYGADYSCTTVNRESQAGPALARVVGKHCESGDIVVMDEYLPADLHPGDLLAVPGTGAYCRALSNQYNHIPRPPVVAVRDGNARVIVRRESVEDILALDVD